MLFSEEVERVGGGGRGRKGNERGKEETKEENEEEKKKRDLERDFSFTNILPALRIISQLSLLCHFPPGVVKLGLS